MKNRSKLGAAALEHNRLVAERQDERLKKEIVAHGLDMATNAELLNELRKRLKL